MRVPPAASGRVVWRVSAFGLSKTIPHASLEGRDRHFPGTTKLLLLGVCIQAERESAD